MARDSSLGWVEYQIADSLQLVAYITFALGVGAALWLINWFSQPGPFSAGGSVTPGQLVIAGAVAFYHVMWGLLCLGVSRALLKKPVPISPAVARVPTTTVCPKCNKTFQGDLRGQFCEECGNKL
jgi:hypothetical protein